MKKPTIVILIPCWGKPDILSLVSDQLDVLYEKTRSKINLMVLYVFSPEDPEVHVLHRVYSAASHRSSLIMADNSQLGAKLNAGIAEAAKFDYDYIMNLGSDDLIHPNLFDLYLGYIYAKVFVIGISSLYFYKKGELPVSFTDYNYPHVIGAGRLIRRDVVERVTEKFGGLYSPDLKRGMDTFSAKRIRACGFTEMSVYRGSFPYIVDIKSDVNINSWEQITKSANLDRYRKMPVSVIENEFEILKPSNFTNY